MRFTSVGCHFVLVHLHQHIMDTFCIGESVDSITNMLNMLNKALKELADWCTQNYLVPHPKKCKAMILHQGSFIGPLNALSLGNHTIKWVLQSRVLGVTTDKNLTWTPHVVEIKKGFANKLNLKRSRFLPGHMLLNLYFKIILPSVIYAYWSPS